jgi:hypothetical protein
VESEEEEETEAGLGSRSNLQEVMNASWNLRGIGGVKMQLDICCAIMEEATESVCQMVTAVSQRKGLLKRSKGPLREERAAREEGHRKKVEGFRVDLEEKREKDRLEKEKRAEERRANKKGGGVEKEACRIEGRDGGKKNAGSIGKRGVFEAAGGVREDRVGYCEKDDVL